MLLSDVAAGEESRPLTELTKEPRFLQGLFPLAERLGRLADSVESAYGQYHELVYLRTPLKLSFILTLSLVLLLSLFAAVWVALFSARRVVAPLRDVALGTRAVAAGDYETRLLPAGKDEVGFLVASFNEMTRELARARDARDRASVSSRSNAATWKRCSNDCRAAFSPWTSKAGSTPPTRPPSRFWASRSMSRSAGPCRKSPRSIPICSHSRKVSNPICKSPKAPSCDWREEVLLSRAGGRRILMCSGTGLSGVEEPPGGHVIVFDDLTELVEAQRKAAGARSPVDSRTR